MVVVPARFGWLHVALALLAAHCDVRAQSLPPQSQNPDVPYNFDPSTAIIVIVLVCAFFCIGFFSIYIRQCVESNAQAVALAHHPQLTRSSGLDHALVESFPIFVYSYVKELKIGKGALECAVCLSEFEDHDTLRLLPKCSHVFHPDCIDAWLDSHVTCPVCRAKLSPESNHGKDPPLPSNTDPNSVTEQGLGQNQVVVDVSEDQIRVIEAIDVANRSPRARITGKFPRSHSTGHSLVQPGECVERYTLRLPEGVRKQIFRDCRLKRTMSYGIVLAGEGSSRKGYRSGGGGEGSSRGRSFWVFSRAPPSASRTGSVKSQKMGGADMEGSNSGARSVLTAVSGPLACLNVRAEQMEESFRRPPV